MSDRFLKRIGYQGDLSTLLAKVANAYEIGEYTGHAVIEAGYEDCNLQLKTSKSTYFVKIFFESRTDAECERYVKVIRAAIKAGVNHPELLKVKSSFLYRPEGTNLRLVVMDWLDGKSFFDSKAPTDEDRVKLVQQATLINKIDIDLTPEEFVYDTWAINNFEAEFNKWSKFLDENDRIAIARALESYQSLNVEQLPKVFVHGDLISSNLMLFENKIWVYDFSVSNIYPRVQELAVLLADMFFNDNDETDTLRLYRYLIDLYQQDIKLTDEELRALPIFTRASHAMHVIGTTKSEQQGEGGEENDYWLAKGRAGLSVNYEEAA